jgi:transposase InsO family protein
MAPSFTLVEVEGRVLSLRGFAKKTGSGHIFGGIGKPTTLGKVERFNRTFKELYPRFNSMGRFIHYYNFEKPHRGLNYATPASIYLK